jgi:integrase
MRSEYITREVWEALLPSMTYENALAIAVSLETGLRIGDVLRLQVSDLSDSNISYTAQKTGKSGIAACSPSLIARLRSNAHGGTCCFPARMGSKHPCRSRQAVWANVRKAATAAGIKPHVSPHTARKTYAVDLYHRRGIAAVQAALQHGSVNTTNLYALADAQGATYDRDRLVRDVAAEVMRRLSQTIGVDLDAEPPELPVIYGEDDL